MLQLESASNERMIIGHAFLEQSHDLGVVQLGHMDGVDGDDAVALDNTCPLSLAS